MKSIIIIIVLALVAIIMPNWSSKKEANNDVSINVNMGLWKACTNVSEGSIKRKKCTNIPNNASIIHNLYICRVLAIIGVVIVFISMFLAKQQVILLALGGVLLILTCIIWSIKLLKYIDDNGEKVELNPDYSFFLCLSSGVLAIITAIYKHFS